MSNDKLYMFYHRTLAEAGLNGRAQMAYALVELADDIATTTKTDSAAGNDLRTLMKAYRSVKEDLLG